MSIWFSLFIHFILHYRLRKDINDDDTNNTKVSVNDFIVKASSLALQDVPEVNSSWMESFVRRYYSSDVSIAVSTEGGLITPIIFNAESKVNYILKFIPLYDHYARVWKLLVLKWEN